MNIHKPEIVELLALVENKYNKKLHTTTDYEEFSLHFKQQTGENISASTLKRLWGYVSDSHTPRQHTLNLLAKYINHENFTQFCF